MSEAASHQPAESPTRRLRVEIVAVGTELLRPGRADTNSLWMTEKLAEIGAFVERKSVVADRIPDIQSALRNALQAGSDIVIFSGGLGPTNDDLTREAVCSLLGRPLHVDPQLAARLEEFYARFKLTLNENNLRQATVPEGGEVIANPKGTAPGVFIPEGDALVFLLPGPPRELCPMFDKKVLPMIRRRKPVDAVPMRALRVCGWAESKLDTAIESVYAKRTDVETTILSNVGIVDIRYQWVGSGDDERARSVLNDMVAQTREILGESIFAERELELETVVGDLLRQAKRTVAAAESCTGGWIAKALTDVAGSSDYFRAGVVAYSNASKTALLGVNETTLERFGAVSAAVAEQMAVGVRGLAEADYGLATTGIAGPAGGSQDKPVGLVYIALAGPDGVQSRELRLPGGRDLVRLRTTRLAMDWLRRTLRS